MTTRLSLNLEGYEAYLEELQKASTDVDRVVEEGLEAEANVFVSGMQRRAPYERIRRHIRKSSIGRDGHKRYIYVGVLRDTPAEDARIANVWEFGGRHTPDPRHRGRKNRPGIVAHPYIRPSLKQDAGKARLQLENKFEEWLKK